MSTITQNSSYDTTHPSSVEKFLQKYQLGKLLRSCNAKRKGVPLLTLLTFLMSSLFSSRSIYRNFHDKKEQLPFCENTFRNFLNDGSINWTKVLLIFSKQVIAQLLPLSSEKRIHAFIVDDSIYERLSAKQAELSATQYDHAHHLYKRSYRFLQIAWSDGATLIPVLFGLLTGSKESVPCRKTDARSNAAKRRREAQMEMPALVLKLLTQALHAGIKAEHVLFDSWFSSPKMFAKLQEIGLHCTTMLKKSGKLYYRYEGQLLSVVQIYNRCKKRRGRANYKLEVFVTAEYKMGKTIHQVPLKLVYVRNRSKKGNDYLVLATTQTDLSAEDVIALYGRRWSIEVYFKTCKQYLHLSQYQGIDYDGIYAHTALISLAYTMLAIAEREAIDDRTLGDLFFAMLDELEALPYVEAYALLLSLFEQVFQDVPLISEETVQSILIQFKAHLPQGFQKLMNAA